MRLRRLLLALMALMAVSPPSHAGAFYTANALYALCESAVQTDLFNCVGYVGGIADALSSTTRDEPVSIGGYRACFPDGISQLDLVNATVKWIEANPQMRSFSAATVVAAGLSNSFPCR